MTPSLFDQLIERLQEKEALELEFKTARGGLPTSLWPTVSAFANTQGGWIVLGVDEAAEPPIVGVTNPDQMLQQFHDLIRNEQKISHPICGPTDASIELIGDKSVIVVRVPAIPRRARPVFISGNPYTGTYVRRHSGDFHCTRLEVDRMIREAQDSGPDSSVLAHYSLNDLDLDALRRYRQRFQTRDPGSPWNGYDDQRFLHAIGAYRSDRESGAEGVTVAGLMLLGKPESITEWRTRHLIDFRLLPDEASDQRWLDREAWEGGVFQAFEVIYPKLVTGLMAPFQLEGGFRVDQGPQQEALREALVNLLVHADYTERDASLIKRMPEGYSFRNPGNSRVLESDLLAGDRSDPRNPSLVRMFRFVGLADEAGTGMPKIIQAWRSLGFQLPDIEVGTERYEFALTLRHAHFLSDDDRNWLRSLGDHWNEAEQLALVLARHQGEVDNISVRRLTGQHMVEVTRVLVGLRDRGLLQMIGVKRGARYQLEAAIAASLATTKVDSGTNEPSSGTNEPSSGTSEPRSGRSSPDSGNLAPSSGDFGQSSGNLAPSSGGSDDAWIQLGELARSVRERPYLAATARDAVILRLCAVQPLSIQQLSTLMGRGTDLIRAAIRPLLASEQLRLLYPRQPNHPRQKYVATEVGIDPTEKAGTHP